MSSNNNLVQSEFRYDDGKSPLALLAETCRNIGVDTTTSKLTKSSIDHTKSFSSKSSTSPSSSSSLESTRKSNDSCRLSVSPLRNGSDKQSTLSVSSNSRISANSVPGSSNTNLGNGNSTHVIVSNGSTHSSPNYTGTSAGSVNGNREPTKFSFKPYEDHVTNKRTCIEDSRSHSVFNHNYPQQVQSSRSPLNSDTYKNNKDNQYNSNSVITSKPSESVSSKRESETNGGSPPTTHSNGYDETNKKIQKYNSLESTSSSISSSSSTPSMSNTSSTPSVVSKSTLSSSTPTSTTASVSHQTPPSSKLHQLNVDSVNKFVPYSSLSPYLGLPHHPHPSPHDPASTAAAAARLNAAAAAVAGYCHSPSVCRDPFCPGCRFNAAAASNVLGQVSACAAGCTQCSHGSMASSLNLAAALQANSPYLHGNAFYPLLHSPHHPSNPNNPSNNPSNVNQPGNVNMNKLNTCNWVVNNTFCGKRFNSAEELHQHLRNHTSSDPTSVSALAFLGQYPHLDPMLTSPIAGLRRTAFDPVNRYHPYKPFTNLPNGLGGSPNLPPSHSVSPRSQMNLSYPPYGPYAGRLGPPIPP